MPGEACYGLPRRTELFCTYYVSDSSQIFCDTSTTDTGSILGSETEEMTEKQHLQDRKLKKYEKPFGRRALEGIDDKPSFFEEFAPSNKSPAA